MSQRYHAMFETLEQKKQGAFVPFVTVGDPDLDTSYEIITTLIDNGADALELGIPFSDPIADGPTIQAANIRALESNVTPEQAFELLARVRKYHADIPIGLLLYSNLVLAYGIEAFYAKMAQIGVDSLLVADIPVRESKPFRQAAMAHNIAPIFIAAPNTPEDTLRQVASYGRGYTYLLSRAGVTGAESVAEMPAEAMINKLSMFNAAKPLLGFGISTPEQVQNAIASGAAGAISGSAVVNIIANNLDNKTEMLAQLGGFVSGMKAATQK